MPPVAFRVSVPALIVVAPLAFLTDAGEENPALGRRGLRALAAHEEVLRDQLTALAQAVFQALHAVGGALPAHHLGADGRVRGEDSESGSAS